VAMSLHIVPATPTKVPAIAHEAKSAALDAAGNRWVRRCMRFGYIVRGVIYLVMGVIAVRLAFGIRGAAMSQTGAIATIGHQPFGIILLVSVGVGLAGYSLWNAVCAALDPFHEGHSIGGLMTRAGLASSAIAYAALLVVTVRFILGSHSHGTTSYAWITQLLAKPYGAWVVGMSGLAGIAGAVLGEIVPGIRGSFRESLDLARRSRLEQRWAMRMGRIGIITRGVMFAIIGIYLVAAAFHANPHHQTGTDGALLGLARQPFGLALLSGAGLGLIIFGVFSIMCARWMRMHIVSGPRSPSPSV
ncbi:MAG TPA: DUF1206 domain-containing protein, partial [Candidatus Krumholzibacteria bacterium]|nr:DUF1206 domain-containing protein [Candidatus Krumholzibacteria bacterium]